MTIGAQRVQLRAIGLRAACVPLALCGVGKRWRSTEESMSNSDIHLKLDGIKGESVDLQHKDEIDIFSWNWGVAAPLPVAGGGGGGAGRPAFTDLTFTHRADRASPGLWAACATGRHIKEARLAIAHAGAAAPDYILIKLGDVAVTSVALADVANDGQAPLETVTLHYAKVEYDYRPQNANGSLGGAVVFKYDLKAGKAG